LSEPAQTTAASWGASGLKGAELRALALVALLAFSLRLWGNGFGLPDTFAPDEPKMVNHALAFGLGDLNPHYFVYPAFQMYLLFAAYGALFVVLALTGSVTSVEGFKLLFLSDPSLFYQVGRGLTALFGTGEVLLLFVLARRLYGSAAVGLLAALALAVHPIDVLHGHYVTADVPMTFFLLLGLVLLAPALHAPSTRDHIRAGLAGGLATAVKYSGLVFVLPMLAANLIGSPRTGRRIMLPALVAGLAALALAFCVASPYSIVEWRQTLDAVRFIRDVKRDGQFGIARGPSWQTYLYLGFLASPLALASLGGVAWAMWKRTVADLLILSLALPYFLAVGSSQSHSARYLVPLLPLFMLLAARLVHALSAARRLRMAPSLAWAAAVLVALAHTIVLNRELQLPDTRRAAREWIEQEIPAGSTIALEWGGDDTVRLADSVESLQEKIRDYEAGVRRSDHNTQRQMIAALRLLQKAQAGRPGYRLVRIGDNADNNLQKVRQDVDQLRAAGVGWVVTSSAALGDPRTDAFARAYPDIATFYRQLEREAELVRRFERTPGRLRGPVIVIYRLPAAAPPRARVASKGAEG
jgi:4-amino-4-deoxy-L-arabinose transferase-like glycosyltransferase